MATPTCPECGANGPGDIVEREVKIRTVYDFADDGQPLTNDEANDEFVALECQACGSEITEGALAEASDVEATE